MQQTAERLARVLKSPACPPVLGGLLTWQLVKAAFGFCGETIRYEFFVWLTEQRREEFGLCGYCGQPKEDRRDPMCPSCWEECERAELEVAEVPKGIH